MNGTWASPAAAIVANRRVGTLSGEPKCGPPRCDSRSLAVSSMIPCDTDTLRSAAASPRVSSPGFRCGSRPVSFKTSPAISAR